MFPSAEVIAKGFVGEGLCPSPTQAGITNGSLEEGGSSAHEFATNGGAEEGRTGPRPTGEAGPSSDTATAFPLSLLLDLRRETTVTQSLAATGSTGDPTTP
jgi:hypothetical protein